MTGRTRCIAWIAVALAILWVSPAATQNVDPAANGLWCSVEGDSVLISWAVAGMEPNLASSGLLERDGTVIARISAGNTSYTDSGVPAGSHVYRLVAATSAGETFAWECEVLVGEEKPLVRCEASGVIVMVTWTVPDDIFAFGFLVSRDGQLVATLGPDARSYREEAPPGKHVYLVSTNNLLGALGDPALGAPDFLIGECAVLVEGGDPELPGPEDLRCDVAESFPVQIQLSWRNPVRYDSIVVTRDNRHVATLDGSAVTFRELDPGAGLHLYEVYGVRANQRSPAATCFVETSGPPAGDRLYLVPHPATAGGDPNTDPAGNAGTAATDAVTALLTTRRAVQGWSFGIGSDPSVLVVAEATTAGTDAAALNGGEGPTFLVIRVLEQGVTMAAIVDERDPADTLPPGEGRSLLRVTYTPGPDAERGTPYGVHFSSDLGEPPVDTLLVAEGFEIRPATSPGLVMFAARAFLRGDGNNDGQVDMSDGIYVLDWLFCGKAEPVCLEAADVNGTREVNIADAVYLFQALFIGGAEPPAPYPDCGSVPLALGCDASACE